MMSFFQNIWIALTTDNEILLKIISVPLTFLDLYVQIVLSSALLNFNCNRQQKFKFIIISSVLGILSSLFMPDLFSTFFKMIVWLTLVIVIFKTSFLKGLLSVVIAYGITAILEFIFARLLLAFNITADSILKVPLYRTAVVLTIYFIIWLLGKFIQYFKINIRIFDNMHTKSKILLIANSILIIIVIGMQFYLIRYYSSNMPLIITLINTLALIAYFILSIYSIINSSKLEITARDLEGANLTIHSLRILHDTVRTFKHDFDNIVNSMGGYIRTNDMEGLNKYYEQLLKDCNKTNNLYSLDPTVINHPAIYNILATKYYIADELNIQINLDIFLDLNEIEKHMKIYEFTRILGILLDNAIEAASECSEKIINVCFRKEDKKHRFIISIENTYTNKDVDTEKIFEKGETSKKDNKYSGLGLWKVRQILNKNNNLNLYTSKNIDFFKQQLEIYY